MANAYLINPVRKSARRKKSHRKKRTNMARKKLYGAAKKAHAKKVARLKRRKRSNPAKAIAPKRRKRRKNHAVKSAPKRQNMARRKKKRSYKKRSKRKSRRNPVMRLPKLGLGNMGNTVVTGLLASSALAGTFVLSAWANRQAEGRIPMLSSGLGNLALKVGVAAAVVYASRMVVRDSGLRKVAVAGAFFPLTMDLISQVAPQLAAQIPSIGASQIPAAAPVAALGMTPGPRISDYTLDAELEAELEQETEQGMY